MNFPSFDGFCGAGGRLGLNFPSFDGFNALIHGARFSSLEDDLLQGCRPVNDWRVEADSWQAATAPR